jgi:hypothetical protein
VESVARGVEAVRGMRWAYRSEIKLSVPRATLKDYANRTGKEAEALVAMGIEETMHFPLKY